MSATGLAAAMLAVLVTAAGAGAHEGAAAHDTFGISTLDQTITGSDPTKGFSFLRPAGGEPYVVRGDRVAESYYAWSPKPGLRFVALDTVADAGDGTLSIFATMLDHGSPIRAPDSGTPAGGMTTSTLASIGRTLTWNDPDRHPDASDGDRNDRNVELGLPKRRGGT